MPASTTRRATRPRTTASAPSAGPRRAAILGGNRIPFARADGPYARASDQDMLTTALEGLVARFGLAGERVGEVAAGAVLKHSRDFNLTREAVLGSSLRLDDARLRRPAGLRDRASRRPSSWPTRSPSARSSPASPPASTRPRTPRSPSARGCARRCCGPTPPARPWTGPRPSPRSARATWSRRRRATSSRAPACRWATTWRITAKEWGITREAQDELTLRSHQRLAAAYERGFFDDLVTPYLGSPATPTSARTPPWRSSRR